MTFCVVCITINDTKSREDRSEKIEARSEKTEAKKRKGGEAVLIAIQENSEVPLYQQIRDQIVQGISDGRLQPGQRLPTVRALAQQAGINAMTVNKAYQMLKQQGYICTERRNGARVCTRFDGAPHLSQQNRELLARIVSEAKIAGMDLETFLQECRACFEQKPPQPPDHTT